MLIGLCLQVGDAAKCAAISNELLTKYGMHVLSINYPTVKRGTERLRITPTPQHTERMMDEFTDALVKVWQGNGMRFLSPVCRTKCDCQDRCIIYTEKDTDCSKYRSHVAAS